MNFPRRKVAFPKPGLSFHTLFPLILLAFYLPFGFTHDVQGPLAILYLWFGITLEGVLSGKVWQFVTHPLFHGNWLHFFSNAFFIYYFAGRIRHLFGEREVWRIAALAAPLGGLFHILLQGSNPLVGASGVGMGFFVALTTVSPESRMFPLPLRAKNLRNGVLLASLLFVLCNPAYGIPGFQQLGYFLVNIGGTALFQISHLCHLGGALAGWLMVRKYLRKPITLARLQQERARREEDDAKRVA